MPRLDPTAPPVWRSATALQFGAAPLLVIDDPRPWQETLIARLRTGLADADLAGFALEAGVEERRVRAFVARLSPALAASPPSRAAVTLIASPYLAPHVVEQMRARLGLTASVSVRDAPEPGRLAVVLAHYEVDPALGARLAREDAPHLPVVLAPDAAQVGPVITPGFGPCLACLAAARTDRDPAWPLVAAQLLTSPCPPLDPLLVSEAAVLAAQLVSCEDAPTDRVAILRPGSARRLWRVPDVHPGCACRSPAGNATAASPSAPVPVPTTARAYARPA